VYGQGRVRTLRLSSAGYIVPPGSPGNAMDEVHAVRARLGGGIRHHEICSRLDSLIGLLDNAPSVLHFACHSAFTETGGSAISMDGGPLRPSDLAVAVQTHGMAEACPLVFFNACRTAGEVPGLMHMTGWARQFMGAGAGAFIGSLWAVRSSSARTFAETFYHAMVTDGAPLGTASLRARQAIAADDGDPTWLAYTVYGNPSAVIEPAT
jgi:CHAT domain-containing protein